MKVIRILLIFKQGFREVQRLIHPRAIIPIKLGKKVMPDRVVESVGLLCRLCHGLHGDAAGTACYRPDIITAFSAVGACINNLGPAYPMWQTYGAMPGAAKWILCLAMLLGRLEVFTLLVLFTPMFWKGSAAQIA